MGEVAKCTSAFGHKFEGRYSYGEPNADGLSVKGSGSVVEFIKACRPVIYERDVCVRCGATIERTLAEPVQKAS